MNIEQAPKLLKEQIVMNVNIGGHNLRNKFQMNQPLRIHNHYGKATFVYFNSKFINNFILKGLNINFYSFKKHFFNNLNILCVNYVKYSQSLIFG